ncbi:MAG: acyl carrier protein [Clostridiales bacterium]|nr:acyl carrier protein [Clostridiales bacterium]
MSTFETVRTLLARQLEISPDTIDEKTKILDDLGADSLDLVELITTLEEGYNIIITSDLSGEIITVGDIVNFIDRQLASGGLK